jgi:TonB family protein
MRRSPVWVAGACAIAFFGGYVYNAMHEDKLTLHPAPALAPALAPAATAPAGSAAAPAAAEPVAPPAPEAPASAAPVAAAPRPATPAPAAVRAPTGPTLHVRNQVMPELPQIAKALGISTGHVVVVLHVDPQGTVERVERVSVTPPEIYDDAMEQAFSRWTFDPLGIPGRMTVEVEVKPPRH